MQMGNYLRTGIGYNVDLLKKNNRELFNKYRLLFAFFDNDKEPVIFQNELAQVSPKVAHEFFLEMHPHINAVVEGKMTPEEYMEWIRKNVQINEIE